MNIDDVKKAFDLKKKSGIYLILCNSKGYIGSSINLFVRLNEHFSGLRHENHPNTYLQNAWNKYEKADFECYIIEYCGKAKLQEREQFYVNLYKSNYNEYGYNLSCVIRGNTGYVFTEEQKKKVSDGVRRKLKDVDYKNARQAKIAAFWRSDEGRKLQSEKTTKTWQNPEIKRKRLEGLHASGVYETRKEQQNRPEIRAKLSEASKAHWSDPLQRQKMSEIKKQTFINNPELKEKISQTTKKQMLDPLMRQKLSESMKKFNAENPDRVEEIKAKRLSTFATQEYRNKASNISKSLWQTEEHRTKMCNERKARVIKQETRDMMSERKKALWSNPETYKNTLINRSKVSLEQLAKIKILIDAGCSKSHIVSVMKCSPNTIHSIYHKRNKLYNLLYNTCITQCA